MNKAILTLLAIGFMATSCYASSGNVTVRENGTYTVGAEYMQPTKKPTVDDIQDRQAGVGGFNKPNRDTRIQRITR